MIDVDLKNTINHTSENLRGMMNILEQLGILFFSRCLNVIYSQGGELWRCFEYTSIVSMEKKKIYPLPRVDKLFLPSFVSRPTETSVVYHLIKWIFFYFNKKKKFHVLMIGERKSCRDPFFVCIRENAFNKKHH